LIAGIIPNHACGSLRHGRDNTAPRKVRALDFTYVPERTIKSELPDRAVPDNDKLLRQRSDTKGRHHFLKLKLTANRVGARVESPANDHVARTILPQHHEPAISGGDNFKLCRTIVRREGTDIEGTAKRPLSGTNLALAADSNIETNVSTHIENSLQPRVMTRTIRSRMNPATGAVRLVDRHRHR
jgi:hypothetical protein